MRLPDVVVSRDGRRAVLVERFEDEPYPAQNRDGVHIDAVVQLRPREEPCFAQFFITGTFRAMWNAPGQTLRWDSAFDDALHEILMMALGAFLDENEVPPPPTGSEYTLRVPVTSELFSVFKTSPAHDDLLSAYTEGRVYWSWKYKLGHASFYRWEAQRLGVGVDDLHHAAYPKVNSLWEPGEGDSYRPLPVLVRYYEDKIKASPEGDLSADRYDVAVSFAGEQRQFVEAVATSLKEEGATVFYDGFVELWGKDLTVELERVYRSGSRYVVIFVSNEYVEKAWPNLERQHALAGRIERMDDSVLPARFDPIALPGLPTSVGYIDIGDRTPQDLARLVLNKLDDEGA